jgi:mono/diheme cytochrome c family protein
MCVLTVVHWLTAYIRAIDTGGAAVKILAALALVFLAAISAVSAQTSKPTKGKSPAGNAAVGKKDFLTRCSACHGMDARGKTAMADTLGGVPDLHSKAVQMLTDAKIKEVITSGTDKMPAVPDVNDVEIANLIAFIRSLDKK